MSQSPGSHRIFPSNRHGFLGSIERDPLQGLLHQIPGYGIEAAGLLIKSNLAICTSATWIVQQLADIVNIITSTQVIKHIIYHVQKLMERIPHTETTLLSKVDHFSIQTPAHSPPLILFKKMTWHHGNLLAALMQPG